MTRTSDSRNQRKNLTKVFLMTAALLLACPGMAKALSEIPYSDSFETYAPDSAIVDQTGAGQNGWAGQASTGPVAVAVVTNYGWALDYPLPSATHTQVMQFMGNISNMFSTSQYSDPSQLRTNVTIDLMLQAGQITVPPTMGNDVQAAMYVNTNGHLVIWHSYYELDGGGNPVSTPHVWTELEHTPIASDEWVRVTLTMNYLDVAYPDDEHFYSVRINGGAPLTQVHGYQNTYTLDLDEFPNDPAGQWFLCGDSGYNDSRNPPGVNNKYFSGLSLLGVGMVDDVSITGTYVEPPPGRESLGDWLARYGLSDPNDDADDDGASNGDEYIADTNPLDDQSVFKVVALAVGGNSNRVDWTGTTSPTNVFYYKVYRTGDLLAGAPGWQQWAGNVPVNTSGSNTWWDTAAVDTNQAFYKVQAVSR